MINNEEKRKLKIVFVANTGWYLYNFRLSLIEFLLKKKFEIHLVCPKDIYNKKLIEKGIILHEWKLKKSSTNIFKELISIYSLYKIYVKINPDLVHHFTIKSVFYGTIISKICGIKLIFNSITGLGTFFISTSLKDKFLNLLILPIYKLIINSPNVNLIFQNKSDFNYFIMKNIASKNNSYLIRGSGIDMKFFKNERNNNLFPKNKNWRLLFPSRLTKEKGINELINACDNLWIKNKNFRLFIAGKFDPDQRGNITKEYFESIRKREYIEDIKYQKDMKSLYRNTDIVILPTWREGLSRSLLEAGSMELPIIASNVPGCNDIVIHRKTGLLINKKNSKSIEKAIRLLINDGDLCKKFSKNVRIHIGKYFTNDIINKKTFDLYKMIFTKKNKL